MKRLGVTIGLNRAVTAVALVLAAVAAQSPFF
jgi:hypothetical protein